MRHTASAEGATLERTTGSCVVGKPGEISLPVMSTPAVDLDAPRTTAARPAATRGRGYRRRQNMAPLITMTATPGCGTVYHAFSAGASVQVVDAIGAPNRIARAARRVS